VSSFPATIAAQEATLLTGTPPSVHGVLFDGEEPHVPILIGEWHERVDAGDMADLEARILAEAAGADLLLVSGCPVGDRVERVIDPVPGAPDGFRLHLDDSFALCEPAEARVPAEVVDAWLRTPGIERVLAPAAESAGAWGAPSGRGWILVAERGWAFRESRVAFGRIDPAFDPVLLAFGPAWSTPWPAAVHDWRIAPTLLAAVGESTDGCFDTPLDGVPRPGG
jgi:hypothetical protein